MENRNKIIIGLLSVLVIILGITTVYFGITNNKTNTEKTLIKNELISSQDELEQTQSKLQQSEEKINTIKQTVSDNSTISNTNSTTTSSDPQNNNIDKEKILSEVSVVYDKLYTAFNGINYSNEARINIAQENFTQKAYSQYRSLQDSTVTKNLFDMGTIFSSTNSQKRNLKIELVSEDKVLVSGQVSSEDLSSTNTSTKPDRYKHYLVFVKEDGRWKVDLFD